MSELSTENHYSATRERINHPICMDVCGTGSCGLEKKSKPGLLAAQRASAFEVVILVLIVVFVSQHHFVHHARDVVLLDTGCLELCGRSVGLPHNLLDVGDGLVAPVIVRLYLEALLVHPLHV